ncbi:uncharacterized protein LOC126835417 isoform X1 [Adelges cooleyi]|uniref:uncharacterized protein LOC126835417 isoform X1 n=1 Tax=Adelges cooleyi TaxID=133065 RepID=UPI00217F6151|nr:uncharacterized protein LOC126835417 isoform X1 [Adelges cooleyi]
MRLRCVVLFAIYSFGLIILLDAKCALEDKSKELQFLKQYEVAEKEWKYQDCDENNFVELTYPPLVNLKRRLLEANLTRFFLFDNSTGRYNTSKLDPNYLVTLWREQQIIVVYGECQVASKLLISVAKFMVLGLMNDELINNGESIITMEGVDILWENTQEFTGDEKERLLNQIKGIFENFVTDVLLCLVLDSKHC